MNINELGVTRALGLQAMDEPGAHLPLTHYRPMIYTGPEDESLFYQYENIWAAFKIPLSFHLILVG